MKLDKAKRDELRALEAKATRGPWYRGGIDQDCVLADALATDKEEGHVVCYAYKRSNRDADADFVAAARNALPDLLDDLDEAAQDIATLTRWNDEKNKMLDEARAQLAERNAQIARLKRQLEIEQQATIDLIHARNEDTTRLARERDATLAQCAAMREVIAAARIERRRNPDSMTLELERALDKLDAVSRANSDEG